MTGYLKVPTGGHPGTGGEVMGAARRRQEAITDHDRLRLFREAAGRVRESSVIDQGLTIRMKYSLNTETREGSLTLMDSLPREALESLSTAVRLVYLQKDPPNLFKVHNILRDQGTPVIAKHAAVVRGQYSQVLRDRLWFAPLEKGLNNQDVLDAWWNGNTQHLKVDARRLYESLQQTLGVRFDFLVQTIILQMAGRILDMDDVVADHLGQERLPRI